MKALALRMLLKGLEMLLTPEVFKELGDMILDNIEDWANTHSDEKTKANVMRLCHLVRKAFSLEDDDAVNYATL